MTTGGSGGAPHKNPHAAARVYDGQAFIVVPQKSEYQILNGCGSRVWELIDGKRSRDDIASVIAEEYDVTLEQARDDVTTFLEDLRAHGMLVQGA